MHGCNDLDFTQFCLENDAVFLSCRSPLNKLLLRFNRYYLKGISKTLDYENITVNLCACFVCDISYKNSLVKKTNFIVWPDEEYNDIESLVDPFVFQNTVWQNEIVSCFLAITTIYSIICRIQTVYFLTKSIFDLRKYFSVVTLLLTQRSLQVFSTSWYSIHCYLVSSFQFVKIGEV